MPWPRITEFMRDAAYLTRVGQRTRPLPACSTPSFTLSGGISASRPPNDVKAEIRKARYPQLHLLSIARPGTISLVSPTMPPTVLNPFSGPNRKKRMPDGTLKEYAAEDYARRLVASTGRRCRQPA